MIAYLKSFFNREGMSQMAKLVIIGVVNTVVDFGVFNLFPSSVPLFWRVTLAFAVATEVSYLLNRRWTFQLRGGAGVWRETTVFFLVNGVAWAATVGIVLGAEATFGDLSRLEENVAKLVAGVLILLPKLASYRDLVFRRSLARREASADAAEQGAEPQDQGVPPHLP
ncbi:MAG: GtrA family protein [Acidimicrobiia bacterium]|nr:GtrA family protein [Acidimicrobiia bacterium]